MIPSNGSLLLYALNNPGALLCRQYHSRRMARTGAGMHRDHARAYGLRSRMEGENWMKLVFSMIKNREKWFDSLPQERSVKGVPFG